MRDQFLCQTLDIHRLLAKLCQLCQCCGTVLRFQCVRNVEQITAVGHTCHAAHHIGIDFRRNACAGIQNGQRIAQCTVGQTGDQFRTVRRKLQLFLTCNVFHPAGDILRPDAGKIVPLAAGKNGGGHLLDLSGCQNKDDVGRRFFQRFEQRIECRCGQHVHLIDDVYHVQNAAVIDALADLTLAAGVSIDRMQAVDCLCKDLGAGGFAGAADAGKQVGMAHTVCRDLVFQRSNNGPLAYHILKTLRSPFAVQGTVHGSLPFPAK